MAHRIEVRNKPGVVDAVGEGVKSRLAVDLGLEVRAVRTIDVYTIDKGLSEYELARVRDEVFTDPITQTAAVDRPQADGFDWLLEIGFLPGVTDNVGKTSRDAVRDLLRVPFAEDEAVYFSRQYLVSGPIGRSEADRIAGLLHNPLIQRARIMSRDEFKDAGGMEAWVPKVVLPPSDRVDEVDLDLPEDQLAEIGREGVLDHLADDGTPVRRGPLALSLEALRAIRDYFNRQGRKPTDLELESLAQTWSEHCKHTIFAARLDEVDGLFKSYIQAATREARERLGADDFCVSVFTDNSGVMRFNDDYDVCFKVETHNSPSALDPYGGAITGIVGVNRDPMGTGQGAKLCVNMYGFCFGDPFFKRPLPYRAKGRKNPILHPKAVFEGVRLGVEHGGNKSGIPTPWGFIVFDERYMGKPLVFVGTAGLIPRQLNGKGSSEKQARPGDLIVMAGGRVGKDGIHGATFSSESLHEGSPASAVQIGDPITQKKMHDAQLELRDAGLFSSVTDNGAGGLSCSVGEMANESSGAYIRLDQVPVKYAGLLPYETWISESQERMTYAVPPDRLEAFMAIMRRHEVEATAIGEFTASGRVEVDLKGRRVMDVDLDFLHNGLPRLQLHSTWAPPEHPEPELDDRPDLGPDLVAMLGRLNLCSREYVVRQYDHEVQGGAVIKPLVGVGLDVHQDAIVVRPDLGSMAGLAISSALFPAYGDIDPYAMAEAAIDQAIKNAVSVGADPQRLALLDNFCWCSSNQPDRLGQLKRAARACHDAATRFAVPFISGKDSMFNDFKGYDDADQPVKISVPPTLLVSAIAVVPDVRATVSLEPKAPGDLIYVVGLTRDELGASEYYAHLGERDRGQPWIGANVPRLDADRARLRYGRLHQAIARGHVAGCASVGLGGLAIAFAKMAMAAQLGLALDLTGLPRENHLADAKVLFAETMSRLVVAVAPDRRRDFEATMAGEPLDLVGVANPSGRLVIRAPSGRRVVDVAVAELKAAYKKTLDW